MQILNHKKNNFCVAHFQGKCQQQFPQITAEIEKQEIRMPNNVEIVTATNQTQTSVLVKQLNKNNIDFINKVPQNCYWTNPKKIGYIIEGLQKVKSKYALILDASDVLLTNDIINIVDKFILFDKKIIFGATKSNYPDVLIDKISNRDFRGDFRYINAGTCIGTVKDCLSFYLRAKDILQGDFIYNPTRSEQLIIRETFKDATEYVDFDYQCTLFQTFGYTDIKEVNGDSYIVI